jgi:hypothetical protein
MVFPKRCLKASSTKYTRDIEGATAQSGGDRNLKNNTAAAASYTTATAGNNIIAAAAAAATSYTTATAGDYITAAATSYTTAAAGDYITAAAAAISYTTTISTATTTELCLQASLYCECFGTNLL